MRRASGKSLERFPVVRASSPQPIPAWIDSCQSPYYHGEISGAKLDLLERPELPATTELRGGFEAFAMKPLRFRWKRSMLSTQHWALEKFASRALAKRARSSGAGRGFLKRVVWTPTREGAGLAKGLGSATLAGILADSAAGDARGAAVESFQDLRRGNCGSGTALFNLRESRAGVAPLGSSLSPRHQKPGWVAIGINFAVWVAGMLWLLIAVIIGIAS